MFSKFTLYFISSTRVFLSRFARVLRHRLIYYIYSFSTAEDQHTPRHISGARRSLARISPPFRRARAVFVIAALTTTSRFTYTCARTTYAYSD